jgi:hypothetical protein
MTNAYQNLVATIAFTLASTVLGLFTVVSVLAALEKDPHGCNHSPNNAGCEMNRPIDQQKRGEVA